MADGDDELLFDDAADYVAAAVTGKHPAFTDARKLALYGLYKQATAGPCTTGKPGIFDPSGRAKWDAWHRLGSMPCDAAKWEYVGHVTGAEPEWQAKASAAGGGKKKGPMGPVFSAFARDEEEEREDTDVFPLHEAAGAGDMAEIARLLASSGAHHADARDDVGATPLHFAADRGALGALRLLASSGADVNARDEDGATPLHYATLNGHGEAYALLVELGADALVEDASGHAPKPPKPA